MNDTIPMRSERSEITAEASTNTALKGVAPFDAVGNTLSATHIQNNITRFADYKNRHAAYTGDQFDYPYDADGVKKKVINFCRLIADKGAMWHTAKGFKIEPSPYGGNQSVADELTKVWESNNQRRLMLKHTTDGAVHGDSFLYVTMRTQWMGIPLDKKDYHPVIENLNPAFVTPIYNPHSEEMAACFVQYPTLIDGVIKLFTLYITPTQWTVYHNEVKQFTRPNPFKMVNVVHFKNFYDPTTVFGVPDLTDDLINLNVEYNKAFNSCSNVVKYCGEPTTVLYGARLNELERAANGLYSNLPTDARMETLKPAGDLGAMNQHLENTMSVIGTISGIPKLLLEGNDFRVSNTSGVAMQLMFQPLIEKTDRRRIMAESGYQTVNRLIIAGLENVKGVDFRSQVDVKEHYRQTGITFTSVLPKDEQLELDMVMKRLSANLISHAEAVKQTSKVDDVEKLTLEILADMGLSLAQKYEEAKSNNGEGPNIASVFLSSLALNHDFADTIKSIAGAAKAGVTKDPQLDGDLPKPVKS